MGLLQSYVVTMLLMMSTQNALCVTDNLTDFQPFEPEIARQMALDAFTRLSPYPRNGCIEVYATAPNDFNANEIMDMVLEYLREVIRGKDMDRIPIPDFQETFTKKIGFVNVKGKFEGEDGWLQSTTSIARQRDATIRLDGTTVLLESTLGLRTLNIEMRYSAKLSFISVKGTLRADVHENSVSFSGGLEYASGKCKVFLKTLKLIELGKIQIHVTGLGPLNWLYSKIATWITSRMHDRVRDTIENNMRQIIEKELNLIKCPIPFHSY